MKKIIAVCMIMLGILASCKKADVQPYDRKNGVYFQLYDRWSNTSDTLQYSFVKTQATEYDLMIRVNLQGIPVEYDRKFALKVNAERSTAIEGSDFKTLEEFYHIAAGEFYALVPITLYRGNETLKEGNLIVTLYLEETDDLGLGLDNRQSAVIKYTDRLAKPYYWDEYPSIWGPWSQVKQLTTEAMAGWDFPETREEFFSEPFYTDMYAWSRYMNQYFGRVDVYDENGNKIEPWN